MPMNARLLRPLASGAFNPSVIPGLEAWWDAADATTVTLDSGRVAAIADKSGNSRNATNATSGSTQPDYVSAAHNGRNAMRFAAASSQRLSVPSSAATFNFLHNGTPSFVALVASPGASADPNALLGFAGNNAAIARGVAMYYDDRVAASRNNAVGFNAHNGTEYIALANPVDVFTPQTLGIVDYRFDFANATAADRAFITFNGSANTATNTLTATPSAGNANGDWHVGSLGGSFYFTGDICEMLIFSQHPTASQRTSLRTYLARKWGITLA